MSALRNTGYTMSDRERLDFEAWLAFVELQLVYTDAFGNEIWGKILGFVTARQYNKLVIAQMTRAADEAGGYYSADHLGVWMGATSSRGDVTCLRHEPSLRRSVEEAFRRLDRERQLGYVTA